MLRRCYDKKEQEIHSSYVGCTVCEEWHNFQNFAKWYEENYYEIKNERMHLDKDILFKKNKIYSPDKCVFVPQTINSLFVKCDKLRKDSVIGVQIKKGRKNKYSSVCSVNNKNKTIGYFKTELEAFQAYKEFKENYIKQVANKYKDKIPEKLYLAMYNWEVEIDD